ncbi:MAG: hypothetical protein AB7S71_00175 [Dongiaceae bacterium]
MANVGHSFREYRPTKTALFWSCVGSVVVALVLGFTWGGWVTGATARQMAEDSASAAQAQVAAAVCMERFMGAADAGIQLASLKDIDSAWNRESFVEKGGWAEIAGKEYDDAADLCAAGLMKRDLPAADGAAAADTGSVIQ